jgi:hypothetical protein
LRSGIFIYVTFWQQKNQGSYPRGPYPKRFPTGPVQVELTRQLGQVVTSAAALAGSAVSGVIAAPSNLPRTGKYIIGTIQSLAVF